MAADEAAMSLHNPSIGDFKQVRKHLLDLGGDQWIPERPDPDLEKMRKLYEGYVEELQRQDAKYAWLELYTRMRTK